MAAAPKTSALISGDATFAGPDQGIDFTGGPFNIHALGSGVITRLDRVSSWIGKGGEGTGGVLVYHVNTGPAAGRNIYVAEAVDFDPNLQVGSRVTAGQVLGSVNSSYPGTEIGFADSNGRPVGVRGTSTAGTEFLKVVEMISGSGGASATPTPDQKGSGFFSGVTGTLENVGKAATIPVGAPFGLPSAGGVPVIGGVVDAVESTGKFLGKLVDPSFWLRVLQIVAGGVLILVGLFLLAKQVGLAQPQLREATV